MSNIFGKTIPMPKNDDSFFTPELSSLFSDLVVVLDSFGVDLTAMILVFWILVILLGVFGINLYLTVSRRNSKPEDSTSADKCNGDSTAPKSLDTEVHGESSNKFAADASSLKYLNDVIHWLFGGSREELSEDLMTSWLEAMNNKSKKLVVENGVFVQFVRFYKEQCAAPKVSQVKLTDEINGNLITTLKAVTDRLALEVCVTSRYNAPDLPKDEQFETYKIFLEKFSSLLKVVCITNESLFVVRFLERPETKVQISGPLSSTQAHFSPDVIINAVLNVLTCTVVDLNFMKQNDFPKINQNSQLNEPDSLESQSIERKLLMKVVKAENLEVNSNMKEHEIYCAIEVEEPNQIAKTSSVRENVDSPVWDQHFIFNLNEKSNEILFEIFDIHKSSHSEDNSLTDRGQFLGHGIVSIAELKLNPSQVQTIPIQFKQNTEGQLTVEFLLMEHKKSFSGTIIDEIVPTKIDSLESGNLIYPLSLYSEPSNISQSMSTLSSSGFHDYFGNTETISYELKDQETFDDHSKSSSFINSVERDSSIFNISLSPHKSLAKRTECNNQSVLSENFDLQFDQLYNNKSDVNGRNSEDYGTDRAAILQNRNGTLASNGQTPTSELRKERSLIRNLKKRFSFNKRSKSVERNISFNESTTNGKDLETERARSVPGSREPSIPRETINGKKQESYGNLSIASGRTFLHEDSVLIIETVENGNKKHIVVPNPTARKSRWKRRGVKLHLVNDHLFVAKHISNALLCQVCEKKFARRIGKQAYKCRDCGLMCHKPCHVNVANRCISSSISTLNLELVDGETMDKTSTLPHTVPEVLVTYSGDCQ